MRTSALAATALAVAVAVLAVPSVAEEPAGPTSSTANPTTPATTTPTTGPTTTAAPTRWTVAFGGDSLLTRRTPPTLDPFAGIQPQLRTANLAIVNVETAISARGKAQVKTYTFRSSPTFANQLGAAGVDVGSLANNHALDFGRDALLDTIAYLKAAGVRPVGAGADLDAALRPAELTIGTTRVAVLAGSQIIPPGGWAAGPDRAGIAPAGAHVVNAETQRLLSAVRAAKATHDVVLVVMHWGIERDLCPSAVQKQVGRLLRQAGATAVLGAHPHVLQPIVEDDVNGHGIVAYSLGNFIWDPRGGVAAETGVLELQFTGSTLTGHVFHPHRLDGNGWARAVDPTSALGKSISARTTRRC